MEDTMDVREIVPDEGANAGIFKDGVKAALVSFIAHCRFSDTEVVHVRPGDVRDFWF